MNVETELELRALVTMVKLASGFALGLVVANQPTMFATAREALVEAFGADSVGRLDLDGEVGLYEAIAKAAAPEEARVVLVEGAEHLLDPKGEQRSRAFGELNFRRTALGEACPKPLVFLVPQWAVRELVRSAPDLWSWRSGLYRLRGDADDIGQALAGWRPTHRRPSGNAGSASASSVTSSTSSAPPTHASAQACSSSSPGSTRRSGRTRTPTTPTAGRWPSPSSWATGSERPTRHVAWARSSPRPGGSTTPRSISSGPKRYSASSAEVTTRPR